MGEACVTEVRYFDEGEGVVCTGGQVCPYCKKKVRSGERHEKVEDPSGADRILEIHNRHEDDCWDKWQEDQHNKLESVPQAGLQVSR